MRLSLACLLVGLAGCYIAHEPADTSTGASSPHRDPGTGGPPRPGEAPSSPGGQGGGNASGDLPPSDFPGDGGGPPTSSDGSTVEPWTPGGTVPRSVGCDVSVDSFNCYDSDCDARMDVSLASADILASRGFIHGDEAVVQVLFAEQPFDVQASRGLDVLFDRDGDPSTGQTGGSGDGRVWTFDAWVFVGPDVTESSDRVAVEAVLATDMPMIEVRVPLSAVSDSDREFHYALISAFGGSGGANETAPEVENTYLSSRDVADLTVCPERGAYCDGPFVTRKPFDGCDAVHPSWTTLGDVETVGECFALCAEHPLCREGGVVNYNPTLNTCILDASCSPDRAGYYEYVATGGCGAPEQCWSYQRIDSSERECWNKPPGYGYFEGLSIEECIEQCEKYPRECGNFDRVDWDPRTGDCMTNRGRDCVERGLGYVEYEYKEVPCP